MTPVDTARAVLRRGGLVGLPTETVYGLAADATNDAAVRRIFTIKGRPPTHPLILHISAPDRLAIVAQNISPAAKVLTDSCWPGPLTVLVPKAERVLAVVTGGRDTVGVRVPAHALAIEVLQHFPNGLAAPSANRFGKVSPTTADHVRVDLGADVDFVLDGGACPIGIESTIVDCTQSPPQILRPGGIAVEDIERLLDGVVGQPSGAPRTSGMLASHYAPTCRVHLAESRQAADAVALTLAQQGRSVDVLDPGQDLVYAAQNLYSRLRMADQRNLDDLVAVLPAAVGMGHALRDRLFKAAGQGGQI